MTSIFNIIKNNIICVFDGHIPSDNMIKILNNMDYNDYGKKILICNCQRCEYPIRLVKDRNKPDKYKIHEL